MFTGIIETTGKVLQRIPSDQNLILIIDSPISHELKVDQSVAHNGICLTVTAVADTTHTVCAVPETIAKTTLGEWKTGDLINLERCMPLNGRLDGHIVQGHVDGTARCIRRIDQPGNWLFTFQIEPQFAHLLIEKGSVTINGTSLTCFHVGADTFEVTIIPYTFEHTAIHQVREGDRVNIEFDVVGKYIARMHQLQGDSR